MPRKPDERITQAKELYLKGQKLIEIASQLGVPEGTVRSWKNRYKWDCNVAKEKRNVAKAKKGGQPGNKNAVGGKGGAAPKQNKNAEKHGFFSKYLPEETFSIIQEIEKKGPLDILWENIQIAYAAIVRAQQIMYVKDHEDKTIEKIDSLGYHTQSSPNLKQGISFLYNIRFRWHPVFPLSFSCALYALFQKNISQVLSCALIRIFPKKFLTISQKMPFSKIFLACSADLWYTRCGFTKSHLVL